MNANAIAWLAQQIVWESRLDQLRRGTPVARSSAQVPVPQAA